MDYLDLCCPLSSSTSEEEERRIISKLQTTPMNIFWWRKCMQKVSESNNKSTRDLSPFPREWSVNYIGNNKENSTVKRELLLQDSAENEKANLSCALTDDSSVYSTLTQENRANRDEFGNCRLHPHVQLAKKKKANRFKVFTKNTIERREEWTILHHKCPECEKRRRDNSKGQTITNADKLTYSDSFNITGYNPIPASMTLVSDPEGQTALRVRTEPLSLETIQTISCQTPDGLLDCVVPCDCNGNVLKTDPSKYQIMERYIPLALIDHVSRGGDAWDVLRQSTGEDDMGCNCDLKIHGFSDGLLRFDVVDFNKGESGNFTKGGIRYSFANPDFRNSSIATSMNSREASLRNQEAKFIGGDYSLENVISDLNYLVLSDRKRRKSGIEYLMTNLSSWVDEVCGLGVATEGKNDSFTTKVAERSDGRSTNDLV